MGLADETFAACQRVVGLASEVVGHRHATVNRYLQVGRFDEAAAHQGAVANIALHQCRTHEAISTLHQMVGLTPVNVSAHDEIGEYHYAERAHRRLPMMNPSDAIARAKD